VGALIVRHSLSEKITMSLLDTHALFTNACFCPDAGQVATWSDIGRTIELWRY
jgi:hypothetical protein